MSSQPKAVTSSTPVDSGEIDDTNCSLCKRTFASKYHRDWHIKRMHNGSDNICLICNATFSTASAYKKHCTNQHPPTATLQYENPKQPTEGSPLKIDAFTAQENVALREKIKALKAKLKEVNKIHSMELKLLEKKTKKQLDEQVKGMLKMCIYFCKM